MMQYRNAKYIDATRIECEINHHVYGWIPYGLDPADIDMTVDNNELLAAMKMNNNVAAYIPPTQAEIDAIAAQDIRAKRDHILATVVDPLVSNPLRWADMTSEEQQAWADYRRALLDVPQQVGFPNAVDWPTQPPF